MSGLQILITNHTFAHRGGSELYARDTAIELQKRGHTPVGYSADVGAVAHELLAAKINVVDDLNKLTVPPDLIHGQQHMELMTALLHFPQVPAIQFIHNSSSWYEKPIRFPRILRYVAVDHACRDLLLEHGIPEERIRVLLNFVDLDRFRPRRQSLSPTPRRALLFSNYASEETHLGAVREACTRAQIPLDVVGSMSRTATIEPENILGNYDLVFAKGRSALEAMAIGAAVVLCDYEGSGPMVNTRNFSALRPLNFGRRTLKGPLDPETILEEIRRYDAEESLGVSELVRTSAGHEPVIDELIRLYEDVVSEFGSSVKSEKLAEDRAAAAYVRQLKIDFVANADAASRLRRRIEAVPLVGRIGVKLARALTRRG